MLHSEDRLCTMLRVQDGQVIGKNNSGIRKINSDQWLCSATYLPLLACIPLWSTLELHFVGPQCCRPIAVFYPATLECLQVAAQIPSYAPSSPFAAYGRVLV
jgi:hypothetical protein